MGAKEGNRAPGGRASVGTVQSKAAYKRRGVSHIGIHTCGEALTVEYTPFLRLSCAEKTAHQEQTGVLQYIYSRFVHPSRKSQRRRGFAAAAAAATGFKLGHHKKPAITSCVTEPPKGNELRATEPLRRSPLGPGGRPTQGRDESHLCVSGLLLSVLPRHEHHDSAPAANVRGTPNLWIADKTPKHRTRNEHKKQSQKNLSLRCCFAPLLYVQPENHAERQGGTPLRFSASAGQRYGGMRQGNEHPHSLKTSWSP